MYTYNRVENSYFRCSSTRNISNPINLNHDPKRNDLYYNYLNVKTEPGNKYYYVMGASYYSTSVVPTPIM